MKKYQAVNYRLGAIFLAVIFFIIASSSLFLFTHLRKKETQKLLSDDIVMRVLVMLEDKEGIIFSNVMVYYPETGKALILNVPNNTGAIYASLNRVDAISNVYKMKGLLPYKEEIENLLGINIPFILRFNLSSLVKLTDLLWGLRLFIPYPVDEMNKNNERLLLPSGAVMIDGDKLLQYLAFNTDEEERGDKSEKYQNLLVALLGAFHERREVLLDNRQMFRDFYSLIEVNLKRKDAFLFFNELFSLDSDTIVKLNITGLTRIVDGKKLLFPLNNGVFIKESLNQSTKVLLSTKDSGMNRPYVLEIKNGSGTQGLAKNTARLFENASYEVIDVSNADKSDYEKTVIIDHIGNTEAALTVGEFIKCKNVITDSVKTEREEKAEVDFTIILGRDFDGRFVRN